jgi:DNA-3-methyladenine glycosylase
MGCMHQSWFAQTADKLAEQLIGSVLVRTTPEGLRLTGRIVETEAYLGTEDQASHARNGHRSPRNESMFAKPGTAYVYFTYGMHYCMNVSCSAHGVPHAVLLRALEPLEGLEAMRDHRGQTAKAATRTIREADLCSGPAKLCKALGIDRSLDGHDLTLGETLWIDGPTTASGREAPPRLGHGLREGERITRTPRIGLGASAGAWADMPLRWMIEGSAFTSRRN